ncbi:MAG TPA: insulinase family protein, partial [Bryobacteraceae bacterium]|nr:insulinase family protein [Bryobacteraceae bacterium]
KRQGENEPYGITEQLLTQNTYPAGHPYSWTTIGSMDDLNAASLSDVQEWFKTYYGPSNAVLVLAGDITPQVAKEKVQKYFGDIPAGPPVATHREWIAKMTGTHRGSVEDRVPQARIYKVWNIPGYSQAGDDYLDLVSDCLARGKNSRLYKRLVYDDQIATDVSATVNPGEIGGQFEIRATARPGEDLSKVEKAIDEEVARFLQSGPTAHEMERVKSQYLATFIRGIERIGGFGGKSDVLARNQVFAGSPDAYKTQLKRVREATADDLKTAANRWLADGVYALEVHPFGSYKTEATGVDRSKLPETGTPPDLRLPKLQRATLSNGLKIILAERHEIPVVNLWLKVDAGYAADQFATPGTASMTTSLLDGGTKTRTALEISDQLAVLGAQLTANSNLDLSTVFLSALQTNLNPSLDVFADVILNPAFPESDFRRQQRQRIAGIQREKVTPLQMALRVFPGLIYGKDHAYGLPLTGSGTEASVAKMTREDLVKFHASWFKPNHSTLIVVGDSTLADLQPRLEKIFAGWKPGETPHKNIGTVQQQPKPVIYLIDKPGALQSMIFAGHIAPPTSDPDEIAIQTMNNILGGNFGARINMNLREDKHWSYGAQSLLFGARGQRPFLALAPVQTDKTKESIAEMDKEFRGILGNRPVSAEELAKAQANETLRLPGSRETMNAVGGSISSMIQFGLPDDYYETYAGKVRALKLSDIADVAHKVIRPDNMVWVVVGDRSK